MIRSLLLFPALALAAFAQDNIPQPALPPPSPLVVPARIGVMGNANISLSEVVERVLANDRDLAVSRILREEAGYSLKGAKGFYDPRLGLNTFRQRTISPVSSIIGGAANGKLTSEQVLFDPQLTGAFPILGGTYRLDFTSSRTRSDSTFITLNPQFPTSVSLNLNQPLWKGRSYDDARHRIEVARNNIRLSGEQFRQRVIEIVTLAVQSYWELDYAYRNLQVQLEAVQLAEQQDASNRRQVEQGLLAPTDVVATQTQIATFSQNFFAAQQAVTAAENALKVLMLADRSDLMWGMALIPEERAAAQESLPPLDEALRNALAARPELAESSITIDNNKADLRLSQELTKPQVDGYANLSVSGLAGHSLPPAPNLFTAGTVALTNQVNVLSTLAGIPPIPVSNSSGGGVLPIFVGGYGQSLSTLGSGNFTSAQLGVQFSLPLRNRAAGAQLSTSVAESRRLQTQRQQLEIAIEQDVRNALQVATTARARFNAASTARRNAELQYTSEQRQFQAGTSTVFLVLQRQTDLIAARTREVRARADLGEAAANLDRATAHTLESQKIQLN